jgi:hypothetical protein
VVKAKKTDMKAKLTANPQMPSLDLSTQKGRRAFNTHLMALNLMALKMNAHTAQLLQSKAYLKNAALAQYLKTGVVAELNYKGMPVCVAGDNVIVVYQNGLYLLTTTKGVASKETPSYQFNDEDIPLGFLLPEHKPRRKAHKGFRYVAALNGDEDANLLVAALSSLEMPVFSFGCVGRFYTTKDWVEYKSLLARFRAGSLQVVDYTCDKTRPLTEAQQQQYRNIRRKYGHSSYELQRALEAIPSPKGCTLLANKGPKSARWHQSGTVLLCDAAKRLTLLVGQDGGTYFGCQLPMNAKSVPDAYKVLMPPEVIGKKDVLRQGEWFAVPVLAKDVPSVAECDLAFYEATLPLQEIDGNAHSLMVDDGRVKGGVVYATGGRLDHDQHRSMVLKGKWYTFYRNTALRSVSEEGVD